LQRHSRSPRHIHRCARDAPLASRASIARPK
jgi:hypothetical protein